MKILFDTSVLIAAVIEPHPKHVSAFPWLKRAIKKEFEMLVSSHSLAEVYAVLTTLPLSPRISPIDARHFIRDTIETKARIIPLSTSDYSTVLNQMASHGLSGGSIYDALIARAAQKSKADRLLTFNGGDFRRVWPEGEEIITVP